MRILLIILTTAIIACQSTTKNLGEQFTPRNPVSVDSLLQQLSTVNQIKDIQVEGRVEKSCMSEGCWFTMKNAMGKEVLFNVKGKKFRIPINSPGMEVVVLADAGTDITAEQKTVLSVRGMRFK